MSADSPTSCVHVKQVELNFTAEKYWDSFSLLLDWSPPGSGLAVLSWNKQTVCAESWPKIL